MIKINLNKKVIIFGFIFTFFSSFGQSFFLGLFNPSIRNDLNISHGQFGTIYAAATICSSLALMWFGKKIDYHKISNYSFVVIAILIFSTFFFSLINILYLLIIGIFLMRFSGQGLMSHTSTTVISRYFDKRRGKALSAIWFGLSTAEFVLPILIIFLLSFLSWRSIWQLISLLILIFLPLVKLFTVKKVSLKSRETSDSDVLNETRKKIKNWKRIEVIKDLKFYIISLNMLSVPWIVTGVFVYQSFISESKLWDIYTIPKSFMIYSVTSILTLFFSGFLVDKFTSRKLILFINIPLLIGLIVLYFFSHSFIAYVFFSLVGISNGLANVLGSSTWAEIYGVKFIGSIKALTSALMVFSTAFGTAIFGIFIDLGLSLEAISLISGIYIVLVFFMLLLIRDKINPIKLKKA